MDALVVNYPRDPVSVVVVHTTHWYTLLRPHLQASLVAVDPGYSVSP